MTTQSNRQLRRIVTAQSLIILILLRRMDRIIDEAEQQATEKLQARVKELAEADAMTLEAVWQEREAYRLEVERLKSRPVGKVKRWKVVE